MRRVIVIAMAGASLAGCSSFSLDAFKSTPPPVQLQLDSVPAEAEARTSLGQSCKTPCSVAVTAPDTGFSVSYTLNKYQPATVPVQVIHSGGDLVSSATTTFEPNPAVAQLQPMGPPPKPIRKKPKRPKVPKGIAAAPAQTDSAFPDPSAPPPPAAPPSR
jgi:hypothetical protein